MFWQKKRLDFQFVSDDNHSCLSNATCSFLFCCQFWVFFWVLFANFFSHHSLKSAVPLHFWKACVIMFLLQQTQEREIVYSYSFPLKNWEPQSPVKVISYVFRLHIPTINKFKGFRRANGISSSLKSSSRPMRKLGFVGLRGSPKTKVRTNKNSKSNATWTNKNSKSNAISSETSKTREYRKKRGSCKSNATWSNL